MIILIGRSAILLLCLLSPIGSYSQPFTYQVDTINTTVNTLIVGLDAFDAQNVWASGTNATILSSNDGGNSWSSFVFNATDSLQFRAIIARSADEALVMSAGEGSQSQIFNFSKKTGWQLLYKMPFENGFLDAIEILPDGRGIAYGDAIDSSAFMLISDYKLENWKRITNTPKAIKGEGGFASSGSNIAVDTAGNIWIGTGAGGAANVLLSQNNGKDWVKRNTPMVKGEAAGITSIRQLENKIFITGGDLANNNYTENLFVADNAGKSWRKLPKPSTPGAFYGNAITEYNNQFVYLICGPSGADLLVEDSKKWVNISGSNLWTAEFIRPNQALIAGRNGLMIRLTLNSQ